MSKQSVITNGQSENSFIVESSDKYLSGEAP